MPFDAVEYHTQEKTKAFLHEKYGPLIASAAESMEAAVYLLAAHLIRQSLSVFHNALELLLKGELARIHPALIVAPQQFTFDHLKVWFREDIMNHPRGSEMAVPEVNIARTMAIERTITFIEAMRRVKELYPSVISPWEKKLKDLNDLRNEVTHYGSKGTSTRTYISAILLTAVPFTREFLMEAYNTDLSDLLFARIDRELRAACDTARQLSRDGEQVEANVLNTLWILSAYLRSMPTEFVDERGFIKDEGHRDYELSEQARREFEKEGNYVDIEEFCKICGAYPLFVSLQLCDPGSKQVRAAAIRCFKCGLNITAKSKHLAHFHYGEVASEHRLHFLKDIGEISS